MSTFTDNPVIAPLPAPASSFPPCSPLPAPSLPPQAEEKRRGNRLARPSRDVLLPEMARLSLEGDSNRTISEKLGVPRQTVDRWLRKQRQIWAENAAEKAADALPFALERLTSGYREAMQAWRRSLEDKQTITETTVESTGGNGKTTRKKSVRTETQSGKAALLGIVIRVAKDICDFQAKHLNVLQQAASAARKTDNAAEELNSLREQASQGANESSVAAQQTGPDMPAEYSLGMPPDKEVPEGDQAGPDMPAEYSLGMPPDDAPEEEQASPDMPAEYSMGMPPETSLLAHLAQNQNASASRRCAMNVRRRRAYKNRKVRSGGPALATRSGPTLRDCNRAENSKSFLARLAQNEPSSRGNTEAGPAAAVNRRFFPSGPL